MAYRDLTNNLDVEESVRPQVISGAAVNGEEVDMQGADSALVAVSVGAIVGAAGNGSVSLEESDVSGSGFAAVAASDIEGTEPSALTANSISQFGYKGSKRYIRAVASRGAETSVAVSVTIIRGHLHRAPTEVS